MDQTNYAQGLMHMIKGNFGTGILAMPAAFAHAGLVNAVLGLPALCFISTYCVHLLVDSSRHLEGKTKSTTCFQYASLAKHSFEQGPAWIRPSSNLICCLIEGLLLIAQVGICCVYLVFVTDNVVSILSTYQIHVSVNSVFLAIFPVALGLGFIRTLSRLAIASSMANLSTLIGLVLILQYLACDLDKLDLSQRDNTRPIGEVALGFGSAMYAFEGIAVVLPVYGRLRAPAMMSTWPGIINVTYTLMLALNFAMGLFGFLKFGHDAKDSITLNLPPEPLYDGVRALFLVSVFLSYPLQLYVLNEIIWSWTKRNVFMEREMVDFTGVPCSIEAGLATPAAAAAAPPPAEKNPASRGGFSVAPINAEEKKPSSGAGQCSKAMSARPTPPPPPPTVALDSQPADVVAAAARKQLPTIEASLDKYEYCCRTGLILLTFVLAVSVPKLYLLMDLIGSITGTSLSLVFPAIIHVIAFWDEKHGFQKTAMILIDLLIVMVGLFACACGTISSLHSIMRTFGLQ